MKVAFITRSTLYSIKGGDSIQVLKTAEYLKKIGVHTDIYLSTDSIPYKQYDLLHFFNIIRPADHLYHIKKSKKPYVVSTIYLDYSSFDRFGRGSIHRLLFNALGKTGSEYLKNIFRYLRKQDRMVSTEYILGHRRALNKVLSGADLILPNSVSEYKRLSKDTGFSGDYHVVPNGVDAHIFGQIPEGISREDKVVCVAQIYGMKNQLMLIKACEQLDLPLEIIGKPPPNHKQYYKLCREAAGKKVEFIDFMPQDQLLQYYAAARVHALPSWFETTGLSSLEAGAMGCNIVVGTIGDTLDYFKDMACYSEADDVNSLVQAISNALSQENTGKLRDYILKHYTWAKAAEETLLAYKTVLS